jgi:hypothetical protein
VPTAPHPRQKLTVADYLERERTALEKSEYLDGRPWPVGPGGAARGRVAASLRHALGVRLADHPVWYVSPPGGVRASAAGLYA